MSVVVKPWSTPYLLFFPAILVLYVKSYTYSKHPLSVPALPDHNGLMGTDSEYVMLKDVFVIHQSLRWLQKLSLCCILLSGV